MHINQGVFSSARAYVFHAAGTPRGTRSQTVSPHKAVLCGFVPNPHAVSLYLSAPFCTVLRTCRYTKVRGIFGIYYPRTKQLRICTANFLAPLLDVAQIVCNSKEEGLAVEADLTRR